MAQAGGGLIIIVPQFTQKVACYHWNTGWNIGQLAMFMVTCGICCRDSHFRKIASNVCGHGIKKEIPPTNFDIEASLPYLPKGLSDTHTITNGHHHLEGDLIEATPKDFKRKIDEVENLRQRIQHLSDEITALKNSNSWKITRPLRILKRKFKRFFNLVYKEGIS